MLSNCCLTHPETAAASPELCPLTLSLEDGRDILALMAFIQVLFQTHPLQPLLYHSPHNLCSLPICKTLVPAISP